MSFSKILGYARNCFWLLVPILIFNMLFTSLLPAAYQMNVFWKDIPKAISLPENLLRMIVMILPVFMRLRFSTMSQKLGLALYLTGLLVYFASWTVLIVSPQSAWSMSVIGFMAPAWTPIIWLLGISLIGNELLLPGVTFKPWMYGVLSVLFLIFHNLHAATIYSRSIIR
jgi:hypothetical protein